MINRIIQYISPAIALRRKIAQIRLSLLGNMDGKIRERRFDGASRTHRFAQWHRPGSDADSATMSSSARLRNGSRDLTRNNPWAEKALQVIQSNVVGSGIKGRIKTGGSTPPELTSKWRTWTETTQIDSEGRMDLSAMQNLIMRTIAESGEVLVRRLWIEPLQGQSELPIRLQILEPDHLDDTKDGALNTGGVIRGGIEFDGNGDRVAYHLYNEHPGSTGPFGTYALKSHRITANDVIHAYEIRRPGQTRGYPWSAPAIRRMKDFDDFEDAQLVRQKLAACFTAFIHDISAYSGQVGLGPDSPDETQLEYLQPGVIERLPPGKEITFPTPPAPENTDTYTRNVLRGIAAAYGITYEAFVGDYGHVNFSSGRMGWIEMSRNVARWQSMLRIQVLDVIATWFIEAAGAEGAIVKWVFPRREMVDPTREVPALIKSIRAGLTSLQQAHAAFGLDSEDVINEIAEDYQTIDAAGVVIESDVRSDHLNEIK